MTKVVRVSVDLEKPELRVWERVQGYALKSDGGCILTDIEVETVVTDPVKIRDFFR